MHLLSMQEALDSTPVLENNQKKTLRCCSLPPQICSQIGSHADVLGRPEAWLAHVCSFLELLPYT